MNETVTNQGTTSNRIGSIPSTLSLPMFVASSETGSVSYSHVLTPFFLTNQWPG